MRRRQAGVAFWGGATKQTRVIIQYAKTNRGVFVSYNKHGTGRGGQGTHIWNILSAASAEAAQRLLQPPRARGRHGGRAAGPGAALGRPTPTPRAATAKPCPLRGDGRRQTPQRISRPNFSSNFTPTYRRGGCGFLMKPCGLCGRSCSFFLCNTPEGPESCWTMAFVMIPFCA